MKQQISTSIAILAFATLSLQILHSEETPVTQSSISERLPAINSLSKDQVVNEYRELSRELSETFRNFILEHPPMSSAEIDAYRADFMELNIDLFIEKDLLRNRRIQQAHETAGRSPQPAAQDIQRSRARILSEISEMRANASTKNP